MNKRNSDELIHDFVKETRDELPERVYAAVRHEIDQSPQRIVLGPWRTPFMNNMSRYAMAGAALVAVAVVAVLAFTVFGKQAPTIGVGPTTTATSSDTPTPEPTLSFTVLTASDKGNQLAAGTYAITIPSRVTYTFTLPNGWWLDDIGSGRVQLHRSRANPDDWTTTLFLSGVKTVYTDPCNVPQSGAPVDQTVPAIVAALTNQIGTSASAPEPVQLNGATGSTFTVDITLSPDNCANNNIAQWRDPSDFDAPWGGGPHERLWVLDPGQGNPIIAEVTSFQTTSPDERDAGEQVVSSMTFK